MKDPMLSKIQPMVRKELCENTYQALNLLVDNSYSAQKYLFPQGIGSERGGFNEVCTIRLCTARGCGHTRGAARVAFERFNHVLCLAPKEVMAKNFFEQFLQSVQEDAKVKKVSYQIQSRASMDITFDGSSYYFRGLGSNWDQIKEVASSIQLEAVFVDCASMVSQKQVDEIYEFLGHEMMKTTGYPFFIFME